MNRTTSSSPEPPSESPSEPESEPESGPQSEPPDLHIFDTLPDGQLACRVCGALIAGEGSYARMHWDWHEAANGA